MRFRMQVHLIAVCAGALVVAPAAMALSCPFCSAPSLTLAEQVAQSDAVALVQWAGGTKADEKSPGTTIYQVVQVVKQPAGNKAAAVAKGDKIELTRYRAGKPGDLFLLMGTLGTVLEWNSPLEVTETSFNYIVQAPSPEADPGKRLAYFLKFLEFPDPLVANDAYGEFANAPYKDIAPLADQMPREQLRKWVTNPETPQTRLGLYGLLLGLCGKEEDARLMEEKIVAASDDFRLGIDGIMGGYLLLTGADGLDVIDRTKLATKYVTDRAGVPIVDAKGEKKLLPFSETYAAMQALRFMWTYGEGKISPERLRQSMRILLDRPELADLVIADLSRWKDWSVADRMMELYGAKEYDIPSIKRAIVRYFLVCAKDLPEGENVPEPKHVATAKRYLAELREKDPKTVKEAERFFFLQ